MSAQTRARPAPPSGRRRRADEAMHERIRVRRQAVQDARRRRRARLAVGGAILLAVLGAAAVVVASPLFAVADVRASGVDGSRAAEVLDASGLAPGQNMLFADAQAAEMRIRELAWVKRAHVRRLPPSTLEIAVIARQPVAVLNLGDSSWLLDDDGVLLGGGDRNGLLTIEAPAVPLPPPGQPLRDPLVTGALRLHAELPPALAVRLQRVEQGDGGLRARLRGFGGEPSAWVLLGGATDLAAKARSIELVLDRVADARELADGLAAADIEVDVRASLNPVLRPVP